MYAWGRGSGGGVGCNRSNRRSGNVPAASLGLNDLGARVLDAIGQLVDLLGGERRLGDRLLRGNMPNMLTDIEQKKPSLGTSGAAVRQ
jgi:hypothetical protein